jgi:hypothetical protein
MEKPGWLETLYNVNPRLAERAEEELKLKDRKIELIQDQLKSIIGNIDFVRTGGEGQYLKGYNRALDFASSQIETVLNFIKIIK